jgi:hypothetical protein
MANRVEINLKYPQVDALQRNQREALRKGAEAALGRLRRLRYIPYKTGRLDMNTRVNTDNLGKNEVRIVSDVPYAVRVYHMPGTRFTRRVNWNARAYWFEPFLSGEYRSVIWDEFVEVLRELNRRVLG